MRHILVDHARAKKAQKRDAAFQTIETFVTGGIAYDRVLIVNEALEDLARLSPRQSQIVEMRFFGGLSEQEIAAVLRLSHRTVKRDWAMAKAWLQDWFAVPEKRSVSPDPASEGSALPSQAAAARS
jgi:RNA polymerase sigma factor (TIGR02999 family)